MARSIYEVLNVDLSADPATILAAFRRVSSELVRQMADGNNPDAANELKVAQWAYEELSDPIKRQRHDSRLMQAKAAQNSALTASSNAPDEQGMRGATAKKLSNQYAVGAPATRRIAFALVWLAVGVGVTLGTIKILSPSSGAEQVSTPLRMAATQKAPKRVPVGQLGRDAYMALKKLEARTQVGVSYRDYSGVLGEAVFPRKVFLETKAGSVADGFSEPLRAAGEHFGRAGEVWAFKFQENDGEDYVIDSGKYRRFVEAFPEATQVASAMSGRQTVRIDDLVSRHWALAAESLKLAGEVSGLRDRP